MDRTRVHVRRSHSDSRRRARLWDLTARSRRWTQQLESFQKISQPSWSQLRMKASLRTMHCSLFKRWMDPVDETWKESNMLSLVVATKIGTRHFIAFPSWSTKCSKLMEGGVSQS